MRIRFSILLVVSLSAIAWSAAVAVQPGPAADVSDVVTKDVKPSTSAVAADERLAQTVTYNGGYKSLHTVVDSVSAMTGVQVRCGLSDSDWPVRDVPIIVYAKDVPLGKLLRAAADCAHIRMYRKDPDKDHADAKCSYRMYRDKRGNDAISSTLDARETAAWQVADWAWDALVGLANTPESALALPAGTKVGEQLGGLRIPPMNAHQIKLAAQVLASLGPDAKERALFGGAGRRVRESALLREFYDTACEANGVATDDNWARNAWIFVRIDTATAPAPNASDQSCYSAFYIDVSLIPSSPEDANMNFWRFHPIAVVDALKSVEGLKLPPRPDVGDLLKGEDAPPAGFVALKTDEDWKLPALAKKIDLKLEETDYERARRAEMDKYHNAYPKGWRMPTREQLLRALSEASGYSVLCEDFHGHQKYTGGDCVIADFGASVTIADALRAMSRSNKITWFVNERDKLLIGYEKDWRTRHRNLVPGSLLKRLSAKTDGQGADLDDATPVIWLTSDQVRDWIRDAPWDVSFNSGFLEQGLWRLYDSLGPREKAAARSEVGFALALGQDRFIEFFQQLRDEFKTQAFELSAEPPELDALCDPQAMATMTIRVRREPLNQWRVRRATGESSCVTETYVPKQGEPRRYDYVLEIQGQKDNKPFTATAKWNMSFPVYSPEREAALRKLQEKEKPPK